MFVSKWAGAKFVLAVALQTASLDFDQKVTHIVKLQSC